MEVALRVTESVPRSAPLSTPQIKAQVADPEMAVDLGFCLTRYFPRFCLRVALTQTSSTFQPGWHSLFRPLAQVSEQLGTHQLSRYENDLTGP